VAARPIEEVFAFFSRPENLQVITPAWLDFAMVDAPPSLAAGSFIRYRLRWRFIPICWTTEITGCDPPHRFVDHQKSGATLYGITSTHFIRTARAAPCATAFTTHCRSEC
jgi:ligand-binding SRPBCC domain-containing protein